ncbi:YD repeat-containing protein, partial [Porphyromonas loveana]
MDLNGDGLPDKVFKKNGRVFFRAQIPGAYGSTPTFSAPRPIQGLSTLSKGVTTAVEKGAKGIVGIGPISFAKGLSFQNSYSINKNYFADVNGDGLPDYVSGGRVYFNCPVEENGLVVPRFLLGSQASPNPIQGSPLTIPDDEYESGESPDSLQVYSPMQDIVRVWTAPVSGEITIGGAAQLLPPEEGYDTDAYAHADGVRLAIQHGAAELRQLQINKGDHLPHSMSISRPINVSRGDKIYFRLQSGNTSTSNGNFDRVKWAPTVSYLTDAGGPVIAGVGGTPLAEMDENNSLRGSGARMQESGDHHVFATGTDTNGYPLGSYESSRYIQEDGHGMIKLPAGVTSFTLSGSIGKEKTSDGILFSIWPQLNLSEGSLQPIGGTTTAPSISQLWQQAMPAAAGQQTIQTTFSGLQDTVFMLRGEAGTQIAWEKVSTDLKISYSLPTDTTTITLPIVPKLRRYAELSPSSIFMFMQPVSGAASIGHIHVFAPPTGVFSQEELRRPFRMVAKTADGLVSERMLSLAQAIAGTQFEFALEPLKQFEVNILTNNYAFAEKLKNHCSFGYIGNGMGIEGVSLGIYIPNDSLDLYATNHRNWGQFIYNAGGDRYSRPIDEAALANPYGEDPENVSSLDLPFFPLRAESARKRWLGSNPELYVAGDTVCTGRLYANDVVNSGVKVRGATLSAGEVQAVPLVSKTKSTSDYTGVFITTFSQAGGKSQTEMGYQDMNGDGYPDILTPKRIRYTNALGQIEEDLSLDGSTTSNNTSASAGLGGNPVHAYSVVSDIAKGNFKSLVGSDQNQATDSRAANFPLSVDLSQQHNEDTAESAFIDVNGDGLPDKIFKGGSVAYNLGYGFTNPVPAFGIADLRSGQAAYTSGGLGLGFSIGAGSISGGFGYSQSDNHETYSFSDMNGDGLPDYIHVTGDGVYVSLNRGDHLASPIRWGSVDQYSHSQSVSESGNIGATVSFPVFFLKFSVNMGVSVSQSLSRPRTMLADVDGDGYPDWVRSEDANGLSVHLSSIRRTNKLKQVRNSVGGSFTIDYTRTTPDPQLPGGKWVMSSLRIDDGVQADGVPSMMRFEYAQGRHDRREREFMGFGSVVTIDVDTRPTQPTDYRRRVNVYDVSNYYRRGLVLENRVETPTGQKLTETANEYDVYRLTATGNLYTFFKDNTYAADNGSAYAPLRYTRSRQYEGSQSLVVSTVWNDYYFNTGRYGELKSGRFSEKGTLRPDGSGTYDYQTDVFYTDFPGRYVLGLPVRFEVRGASGALLRSIEATYNTEGRMLSFSRQLNADRRAVFLFDYDDLGNLIKKTLPSATTGGDAMSFSYTYDNYKRQFITVITDGEGLTNTFDYDYDYGVMTRFTDTNGQEHTSSIDAFGRLVSISGPYEQSTVGNVPTKPLIKHEYQLTGTNGGSPVASPLNAVTTHYDYRSNKTVRTSTFSDGFGRVVQVKKDGVIAGGADSLRCLIVSGRVQYDAFGRADSTYYPTTESDLSRLKTFTAAPDQIAPTRTIYDRTDRPTLVILPDGSRTQSTYGIDAGLHALTTTITDALGNRVRTGTNGRGLTLLSQQLSGPQGTITTRFEYDALSRLTKVTDTEGNETLSTYDMGDRRTELTHPASGMTTFAYDDRGLLTARTNEGSTISYEYDKAGRPTRVVTLNGSVADSVSYYGNVHAPEGERGRLVLREDRTGASAYRYGRLGEVTEEVRSLVVPNQRVFTFRTKYDYDSYGRLREVETPDRERVSYHYDDDGNLYRITGRAVTGVGTPDNTLYRTGIRYDKFGSKARERNGDGTTTTYAYDNRRRLTSMQVQKGSGSPLLSNAYGYDAVSNILTAETTSGANGWGQISQSYTYDGLYRLTSATGQKAGGTGTAYSLTMSYDNMHRIVKKKQDLRQSNVQFAGQLSAGYELDYAYRGEAGSRFRLDTLRDRHYCVEGAPVAGDEERHAY